MFKCAVSVLVAVELGLEVLRVVVHVLGSVELVEMVLFARVAHDGPVVFVNGGVKVGEGLL